MTRSAEDFYAPVPENSIWHKLSSEERKEITRMQLCKFKMSAEYADSVEIEAAVELLRKVFW